MLKTQYNKLLNRSADDADENAFLLAEHSSTANDDFHSAKPGSSSLVGMGLRSRGSWKSALGGTSSTNAFDPLSAINAEIIGGSRALEQQQQAPHSSTTSTNNTSANTATSSTSFSSNNYYYRSASAESKSRSKNGSPSDPNVVFIERKIRKDDSLRNLALRYGVTVADLKRVNGLLTEQEFYGREIIKIPVRKHGIFTEQDNGISDDTTIHSADDISKSNSGTTEKSLSSSTSNSINDNNNKNASQQQQQQQSPTMVEHLVDIDLSPKSLEEIEGRRFLLKMDKNSAASGTENSKFYDAKENNSKNTAGVSSKSLHSSSKPSNEESTTSSPVLQDKTILQKVDENLDKAKRHFEQQRQNEASSPLAAENASLADIDVYAAATRNSHLRQTWWQRNVTHFVIVVLLIFIVILIPLFFLLYEILMAVEGNDVTIP